MDTVLGLSLTGGSSALFGNLQKVTAEELGLSPILMGAANRTGGVMQGSEAAIFNAVSGTVSRWRRSSVLS